MNDRNLHFSSTLHLKFILVYIIFGFLAAFIAAMLVPGFIYDQLINSAADDLYKSANIIAIRYLPSYFTEDISLSDVLRTLTIQKMQEILISRAPIMINLKKK